MTDRRVLRSLDVATVIRMTFALSACLWAIVLIGFVALYLLGLVSGGLGGVEGFIASLGFTGFRLAVLPFLVAFVVVGLLASAALSLVAAVLAMLYNALHPIVGGIEIHTKDGP